jgi:hypothetical protein
MVLLGEAAQERARHWGGVAARAWRDEAYQQRLLTDPAAHHYSVSVYSVADAGPSIRRLLVSGAFRRAGRGRGA